MAVAQEKYYQEERGRDLRKLDPSKGEYHRWVVSEMWDLHHEIARRIVLGEKNVDIAEALKISPQMVCNVKNSPVVQERISILRGARDADTIDLAREIKEIAPDAVRLLKDIIRGEGEGKGAPLTLRSREANNMLARNGFGIPHKIQTDNTHTFLTGEDLERIKQRALIAGDVVEVEVIEQ
jgi:hypothetical protein